MFARAFPLLAVMLAGFAGVFLLAQRTASPTAAEWAGRVGGKLAATAPCGRRPTVSDARLTDLAAALPGFTIVNDKALARFRPSVKAFALAHECGHQTVGTSETQADCFAMRRGRAEGWLSEKALAEICAFVTPLKAGRGYLLGPQRCAALRACAARTRPGEEPPAT